MSIFINIFNYLLPIDNLRLLSMTSLKSAESQLAI